jgi:choline dehydrogenase-like flavoprotein
LRDGVDAKKEGIPLKRAYGSDFPYRPVSGATVFESTNCGLKPSYAQGGLSNVWGAALMPYCQSDVEDWPVTLQQLAPFYSEVFDFLPLAGAADGLADDFPLYTQSPVDFPMSNQAKSLLTHLSARKGALKKSGIQFGKARTAVRASSKGRSCVRCGNCMYGCPHELIYFSGATLQDLCGLPNFTYIPGYCVRRVDETGGAVKILATNVETKDSHTFMAERVFLACGVLETTAILLRSLAMYSVEVALKDSQYFLLPILRTSGTPGVRVEQLHTLAQLFVEINDERVSPFTVHLQTYTYNELFEVPVRAALGPLSQIFPTQGLLSRLLLFQGYLHSAHSGTLRLVLSNSSGEEVMSVNGQSNPEAKVILRKVIRKLLSEATRIGVFPLLPLTKMGEPGRGFHSGGSFPMRRRPNAGEADVYGRPYGFQRVHAVDATVFPSVPATTITLTAMANAARIGAEWEQCA